MKISLPDSMVLIHVEVLENLTNYIAQLQNKSSCQCCDRDSEYYREHSNNCSLQKLHDSLQKTRTIN